MNFATIVLGVSFLGALCFALGVAYPAVAIAVYPFYKFFGGSDNFKSYIKKL